MDESHRMLRHQRAVRDEAEAPPPPLRVDVWPEGDVVHVCPAGEIDLDTVSQVRDRLDELRAAGFKRLILDLRAVTFLDSTGIRLVLETGASARADGFEFGLIEGPAKVQRAFEITGLRSALPFIDPCQDGGGRRP
jgi:anti-sigma B factor antagonist